MKRVAAVTAVTVAVSLAVLVASCGRDVDDGAGGAGGGSVTVLAAASLADVTSELTALPEAEKLDPDFSFGGTATLVEQVRQGAPADVVVAADVEQLDPLVAEGLVDDPVVFARNRLVVAVPESPRAGAVTEVGDLAREGVRVVLAAPEVPAGRYAREALDRLGLLGAVERNVVSEDPDVKAVAAKVALGEADAGVVYLTDVRADSRLVAVGEPLPAEARYGAAVVLDGPDPRAGARFVELLRSSAAQAVLQRAGFGPPAEGA